MTRRHFHRQALGLGLITTLAWHRAWALSLQDLSAGELNQALAGTLEQGVQAAVKRKYRVAYTLMIAPTILWQRMRGSRAATGAIKVTIVD